MKLNLGCADRSINGFTGVDIAPGPCVDQIVDLSEPWPWPDSSVEEAKAHDVFEHIGNVSKADAARMGRHWSGRIHVMNELHRVLVPGGQATIEVPSATKGAGYAQDPTHETQWCLNSFQYFQNGKFAVNRLAAAYGTSARFNVLSLTERMYQDEYEEVYKITAVLECVK